MKEIANPLARWSLRAERAALGLTQAQLAARLQVNESTVRRAERRRESGELWRFALRGLAAELWREHIGRSLQLVRFGARVQDSNRRRNAALKGKWRSRTAAEIAELRYPDSAVEVLTGDSNDSQ